MLTHSHPPSDDPAFLDWIFELAVRSLEEGEDPQLDEWLDAREHLRADAAALIHLARALAPGVRSAGPTLPGYEVMQELGQGGMGAVWLARQQRLGGRPVAIKILPAAYAASPRARKRFREEANAIARLHHPNIVTIHDVIDGGDVQAFAMEWVEGSTLARVIGHLRSRDDASHTLAGLREHLDTPNGSLADSTFTIYIVRLGIAIARALAAVHRAGMLHRDVKPSNILIRRDGTPLLSDFGLVRNTEESERTVSLGGFAGTTAYASPEQLLGGDSRIDARSDLYSLGVTLYHALTLRLPFEAHTPVQALKAIEAGAAPPVRRINPRLPIDLQTIVVKAMHPEPGHRYQSADELADDLQRLLTLQPIRARPAGLAERSIKLLRRNRRALAGVLLGGVAMLALCVLAAMWWILFPRWAEEHLREARLGMLAPLYSVNVFSVEFWGLSDEELERHGYKRPLDADTLADVLRSYDAVLRYRPGHALARAERAVVAAALSSQASDPPSDDRSRGLAALLNGDIDAALRTWTRHEESLPPLSEPDPLLTAATGMIHLIRGEAPRAYPRLREACRAFPEAAQLRLYLAEAAAQCGDLELAEQLLEEVPEVLRRDVFGGFRRVQGTLLAFRGEAADAEAVYRSIPGNPVARLALAELLEGEGRIDEALAEYQALVALAPQGRRPRRAFVEAMERWWANLDAGKRAAVMRQTLEHPSGGALSSLRRFREYLASRRMLDNSPNTAPVSRRDSSTGFRQASLSEVIQMMEVDDMAHWNRIVRAPDWVKAVQAAAWGIPMPGLASRVVRHLPGQRMLARLGVVLTAPNRARRVAAAMLGASGIAGFAHGQWTVVNLHPEGASNSYVNLGGSDLQVAGYATVDGVFHAGVWDVQTASWADLHPTGTTLSQGGGARDGWQVGYAKFGSGPGIDGDRASLWNGTAASRIDLHPAGTFASRAWGIREGQQVGWVQPAGQPTGHASLWNGTAESWVNLNPAGASSSTAYGIHNGQQAGGAMIAGVQRAGLWSGTAASWVELHPAGATDSYSYSVHDNQQVGYAAIDGVQHAGMWNSTPTSWTSLHPAQATGSVAQGIYNGQQVGWAVIDGVERASLWSGSAESREDLFLALSGSWGNTQALSIWSDGTTLYIAGHGFNNETGRDEALLWMRPLGGTTPHLTLIADDTCVDADDVVTVSLLLDNTDGTPAAGYQAFLEFDDSALEYIGGAYTASPFGLFFLDPIPVIDGEINLAAGIDPETQSAFAGSATLATFQFKRLSDNCEGSPIAFRSYILPTQLTAPGGAAISGLVLEDSEAIVTDGTPPSWTFLPANIQTDSNQGDCSALVAITPATASDDCGDVSVNGVRSDALALDASYPPGLTTITWTATDACGNFITHDQAVEVLAVSELIVTVELGGDMAPGSITRCIEFEIVACPGSWTESVEVTFINGTGSATISLVCGGAVSYECIRARDALHTLRSTVPIVLSGLHYEASLTGASALRGGNADGNEFIDILDFGVFVLQYGTTIGVDTFCATPAPHADFNGDGFVDMGDYAFIQAGFLQFDEEVCVCSEPVLVDRKRERRSIERISVTALLTTNRAHLTRADLNRDGWLDREDMAAFLRGARP